MKEHYELTCASKFSIWQINRSCFALVQSLRKCNCARQSIFCSVIYFRITHIWKTKIASYYHLFLLQHARQEIFMSFQSFLSFIIKFVRVIYLFQLFHYSAHLVCRKQFFSIAWNLSMYVCKNFDKHFSVCLNKCFISSIS